MKKPLFITGIDTGVGKTIVSAALTEQLKADYWKPVQAGDLHCTDSMTVASLISNPVSKIHPEVFMLDLAVSPHQAARDAGLTIRPADITLPETENQLIIEGCGGLLVPLSRQFLMIELISNLSAEVVLVVRNYLGCINHTLLSFQAIQNYGLRLKHVVFNGHFNQDTFDVLTAYLPEHTSWSQLPDFQELNKVNLQNTAWQLPGPQPLSQHSSGYPQ